MRSGASAWLQGAAAAMLLYTLSGCTALRSPAPPEQASTHSESLWMLLSPDEEPSAQVPEVLKPHAPRPPARAQMNNLPAIDHPRIRAHLNRFQTDRRRFFERALERSNRYVPTMAEILRQEGLPTELAYLPLIESAYRTDAISRAGATGPWQFMRGTARRFGLRMDEYVDERRDPIASTYAAARYLRELHEMFRTWPLSLAAYNTGGARIARILERGHTRTYWEMIDRGVLHQETQNYVPQFLAALEIIRRPESYGFTPAPGTGLRFDTVRVKKPITFSAAARLAGVSAQEIADLNPALIRGITPPDPNGYPLRLPEGLGHYFKQQYASWVGAQGSNQVARASVTGPVKYRVRSGDSPVSIARRFGVSVSALMKANGWRDARKLRVGVPVRIPHAAKLVSALRR